MDKTRYRTTIEDAITAANKGIIPSVLSSEEIDSMETPVPGPYLARYVISVFSGLEPDKGNMTDACSVTVYATSRNEAAIKARGLERRNWYFIREVEEVRDV
jgi:hypothetical protein